MIENYNKVQSACIVIEILWIKLKYDLILNSPNLTAHVSKSELSSSSVQSTNIDWKVVASGNMSLLQNFWHVDSLDHWPFLRIWVRDIPDVLAFEVEAALTECDVNISVFIRAYLRTWQIHLDNVHIFTGEWGPIWLNNNWLWFYFSRHGFAWKIYSSNVSKTEILLSSWKCLNSNTSKGLFALLVLVGLIALKQNFLSDFV